MGELQRRIDKSSKDRHEIAIPIELGEALDVIEEAKKDFPETISENMISKKEQEKPYSKRKDYLQTAWILYTKQREWFEKWFG